MLGSKNYKDALKIFNKILRYIPDDFQIMIKKVKIYLELKVIGKFEKVMRQIIKSDRQSEVVYFELSELLEKNKQYSWDIVLMRQV